MRGSSGVTEVILSLPCCSSVGNRRVLGAGCGAQTGHACCYKSKHGHLKIFLNFNPCRLPVPAPAAGLALQPCALFSLLVPNLTQRVTSPLPVRLLRVFSLSALAWSSHLITGTVSLEYFCSPLRQANPLRAATLCGHLWQETMAGGGFGWCGVFLFVLGFLFVVGFFCLTLWISL